MGMICCALSGMLSNVLYFAEKVAGCCAVTSLVTCIVATLLVTLGLGIGLGYNYCYVDLKTRHRYVPPHFRVVPGYGKDYTPPTTLSYWQSMWQFFNTMTFWPTTTRTRTPWGFRSPTIPRYGYPGEVKYTPYPGHPPRYTNREIQKIPWKKIWRSSTGGTFYFDVGPPPYLRRAGGGGTLKNRRAEMWKESNLLADVSDDRNNTVNVVTQSTNIQDSLQDYSDVVEVTKTSTIPHKLTSLLMKFITTD